MSENIAERLRARVAQARLEAALGQAEIERSLGLPPGAVSKIENGARAITSTELAQFARLTGRYLGWFFDEDAVPTPMMRGELASEAGRADLAWLHEFAEAYTFLKSRKVQTNSRSEEKKMSRRQRVKFIAEKPQPTPVKFKTSDGEVVSFVAEKP
jgi:transcriptional regulator with XRE-family HTH domain